MQDGHLSLVSGSTTFEIDAKVTEARDLEIELVRDDGKQVTIVICLDQANPVTIK